MRADKDNATIILNRLDYENKMLDHLWNNESYKELNKDPSGKIVKEVAPTIKNSSLDDGLKTKLTLQTCMVP